MPMPKSVIVYNGGSGGDFLRNICVSTFRPDSDHKILPSGRSLHKNDYFKKFCAMDYDRDAAHATDLNPARCDSVENTHHFRPWFRDRGIKCWFIDYPIEMQKTIVEAYINKVSDGDHNKAYALEVQHGILERVPEKLRHKIQPDNIAHVIALHWNKNLSAWRSNNYLTPIPFSAFFQFNTLLDWIKTISGHETDGATVKQQWVEWYNKNQILMNTLEEKR